MSTTHAVRPPIRGVIWHFTDLHFHPTPPAIREDGKARAYAKANFQANPFQALLKYAKEAGELKADFLVFSGDFVDAASLGEFPDVEARRTARQAAFAHARKFMVEMAKAHGLDREMHERVVVCPGNHDVDWAVAAMEAGQSLTDYLAAFGQFLGHDAERPFTPPGTAGVCILPLDTTPFGGAPFYNITKEKVQLDAGAYVPTRVEEVMEALRNETSERVACPEGVLGIVVSHHPPTVTPTLEVEVKPFEIAIGAGQVKYRLHRDGFRVFLTGHKHMAVAHQEHLYPFDDDPAEGILILTGAPFLAAGGTGRGFSVIEYAISPESGEASVLVHPHDLDGFSPQQQAPRRFSLAPRRLPAASVLRLTQRIGITGDTRADYEFHGIPLPSGNQMAGWEASGQKWIRRFPREEMADQNTASRPLVAPLVPGVTAREDVPEELRNKANRKFHIQLEVAKSTPLRSVGFWERVFNYGAFAVSKGHQRRVCGDQNVCPGVEPGWEGFFHLLREPVERLEFSIHLPFVLGREYPVELETWTVTESGERVHAPHFLRFSSHRIETNFRAKRITVTIEHPIVGVGYSVKWELPENDPALGERGTANAAYEEAIEWATRFQTMVLRFESPDHAAIREAFLEVVEGYIEALRKAGIAAPANVEEVEWTLFVPQRKDHGPVTTNADGRPMLTPAFASYDVHGPRGIAWAAGEGVVGRAFALNSEVEAIRPRSSRYIPPRPEEWMKPPMPVYVPAPGSINHAVLYGLPVHVPYQDTIVWGVLTIGTDREFSTFDLNRPLSPPAHGAPPVPALHVLMKSLTDVFSRKLALFMTDGTAFAEPPPREKP